MLLAGHMPPVRVRCAYVFAAHFPLHALPRLDMPS